MPWVWVCAVVFMDLAMVGHWFHGFVGHALGFVWWVVGVVVMLSVCWVISFGSCRGCGLPWVLFLWLWVDFLGYLWADFGGCGSGLCEVVVDWWWWL